MFDASYDFPSDEYESLPLCMTSSMVKLSLADGGHGVSSADFHRAIDNVPSGLKDGNGMAHACGEQYIFGHLLRSIGESVRFATFSLLVCC